MKKIVVLIFFTFFLPRTIFGQYQLQNTEQVNGFNAIATEQVFIHLNDNLFLSGEYLYYKFHCLDTADNTPSKISKIGYVALLGKDNKIIFQHKIKLESGLGQGDFFIPSDIATGHYKLIGFTQWMRNQGEKSFFNADLAIINPYQELPEIKNQLSCEEIVHSRFDSLPIAERSQNLLSSFQIELQQKTFEKRQLASFFLTNNSDTKWANISISVRKKDSIKTPFTKKNALMIRTNSAMKNKNVLKLIDPIFLPELRGELISGRIISKTSKEPISNQNISLSISGDRGLSRISRSHENGAFYFNIGAGPRNNQIILNILDNNHDFEVLLDTITINSDAFTFKEIKVTQNLNGLLEQRSIYNQIDNTFFAQKTDSLVPSDYTRPAHTYFQETYNLDDYTRFGTLQETIVEVIEDVLVKKRSNSYDIRIRGNDEFFIDSDDEPLLLIDNVLIQNTNLLFDYETKRIQQIGISRNDFYVGPKKYQGIFSIRTKDRDYTKTLPSKNSLTFNFKGSIARKKYYEQKYFPSAQKSNHRTSDFRQQLLWLPNITINSSRSFNFYTSDNTGVYEISIEGFTEKGIPVSLSEEITVK